MFTGGNSGIELPWLVTVSVTELDQRMIETMQIQDSAAHLSQFARLGQ